MDIEKNIKMLEEYCEFKDGTVYVLLLMPRKKENVNQTENMKLARIDRRLVSSIEDVRKSLLDFKYITDTYSDVVYRVYVSVNRRSLLKGLREFQKKMMDYQYDLVNGNQEVYKSIERLGSEWKSQLAKKSCRDQRYFFYDVDLDPDVDRGVQIEEVQHIYKSLKEFTTVKYFGESKTGYAIVTEPFNPTLLWIDDDMDISVEMKNDAYLYVDCVNDI